MAKIDETFSKYSNFKGYVGNAPATEAEYDAMKANAFSGTPPTWSDIQAQMYDINRKFEYPSIQDQLDKIYHSGIDAWKADIKACLLYTSPSPRDGLLSRMPSSA